MKYLYSLLLIVTLMHTSQVMADVVGQNWQLRSPTGTSENLSAIAVNGTTSMVAVGSHGAIVTSTAPGTWAPRTSSVTTDLADVIWSELQQRYIAVGGSSTVLFSTNGTTWTKPTTLLSPATVQLNAVAVVNANKMLAVGGTTTGAGIVFLSTNAGVDWDGIPVAGATTFKDVIFTGSKFIAVCTGKVFTSADGAIWTYTALTGTTPTSVAFIPNTEPTLSAAVIIGTKSWASVNNGPWTAISPPSSDLTLNVVDGELVGANSYGEVWSSTDMGKSWQIRLTPQYIQLNAASKFGDTYVVVGDSGTIEISTGTVADALSRQVVPPLVGQTLPPLLGNFTSVATNGANGAVAVGAGGQILSASAFDTWAKRDSTTTADLAKVIWTGSNYVAVGASATIVTSSDNGVTWAQPRPTTSERLTGLAKSGSVILAVGENTNHNGVTLRSEDGGATWEPSSRLVTFTLNNKTVTSPALVDVAWSGINFVAVANGYSLTSLDGKTWTATPVASLLPTRITVTGGTLQLIITGNKNLISANGTTWTPLTLPAANLLIDAVGNTLRGVSPTGEVWTSSNDGSTWQFLSAAEEKGQGLTASAGFSDGRDVYVGKNGLVETFKTPLSWSPYAASANGVAWNGQSGAAALYVAVGWDISWTGVPTPGGATAGDITWTPHQQGAPGSPFSGVAVLWTGAPGEAAAEGDRFVAVGTHIWTSRDGIEWKEQAHGPSTDPSVYSISQMGSKLYAFAYDNARHQVMLATSQIVAGQEKGATWTPFTDLPGRQWAMLSATKAGAFDNYLAVGWGGHVLQSTTGELGSWREFILPLASGEDFTSVTWDEDFGVYVVVTSKGGIWRSDGLNWGRSNIWKRNASNEWVKSANALASHALWTVKRVRQQLIAAGNSGYLLKSFNGVDWREYAPYGLEGSTSPQYINDLLYTKEGDSRLAIAAGGLGTFLSSEGLGDLEQPTINFNLPITDDDPPETVRLFSEHGAVYPIVMQLKKKIFDVPTTVTLNIISTNKYNVRYRVSTKTLTFPKGETLKAFTLTGIDDHLVQGDEILTLSASASVGDYLVVEDQIGIKDDETLKTVSFAATTSSLAEPLAGFSSVSTIQVKLLDTSTPPVPVAAPAQVVVPLRFSGTAVVGKDYKRPSTSSVTIAAGQTTATFEIEALNDSIAKGTRTVVIDIGQPLTVAGIGVDNRHTLTLTDNDLAPEILTGPVYGLVKLGGSFTFSTTVGTGRVNNNAVGYTGQWLKNGLAIAGQPAKALSGTATTYYNINRAALADAGDYTLAAVSVPGSVKTGIARLAVVDGAPQTVTVKSGGSATLKVVAAGTGLTYQWKKNGTLLSGQVQSTLALSNVTTSGDKYTCTVNLRSYAANGTQLQSLLEDSGEITVNIISAVPVVTPPAFGLAGVGADFAAAPTATPSASLWTVSGLPTGLTYNTSTGAIAGRPARAGSFPITFVASNAVGKSLAVKATLVVSVLPANAIGTFVGNVDRNTAVNNNLGGRLDLVTTATGSFSGKLTDVSGTFAFIGNLGGPPGITRTAAVLVANKTVLIELNASTGTFTGTVGVDADSTLLTGSRQTAAPAARNGVYSFAMAGSDLTKGYSFGRFTIAPAGTLTITGKVAGSTTAFTVSTIIDPNNKIWVYSPLDSGIGSLLGSLNITIGPNSDNNFITGGITWSKSSGSNLALTADGGRYTVPTAGHVVGSLPVAGNNAVLTFEGADLDSGNASKTPDGLFTVKPIATVVPPTVNPASTALGFTPATGEFQGQFTDLFGTTTRQASFYGMLIRPHGDLVMVGRGFFFVGAESPVTGTLVGTVNLARQP